MITRPSHLTARQTSGRAFGESATILRQATGDYDSEGIWQPGAESQIPTDVATAPANLGQAREIEVDGVRRTGERMFWCAVRLYAARTGSTGDRLVWGESVWQLIHVAEWGGFWEALAVRVDAAEVPDTAIVVSTGAFSTAFASAFDRFREAA